MNTTTLAAFHAQRHQTWRTPAEVYAALDSEFRFDFDPCPSGPMSDGLTASWVGKRVYCNPPYNDIEPWLAKGVEAELAVYLLPARTGTRWFAEYAPRAAEVRFVRGRINFRGHGSSGNYEWSVILVFREA